MPKGSRAHRFGGQGPQRFDVLPLTVVTDGALRKFGYDRRRLRPNVIVGGVEGLEERTFAGGLLRLGEVTVEVVKPRSRCVMTTFDPDSLAQDHGVLEHIVKNLGARIALDLPGAHGRNGIRGGRGAFRRRLAGAPVGHARDSCQRRRALPRVGLHHAASVFTGRTAAAASSWFAW